MKKYALAATLLILSKICAADFNTGVQAYNKGDYTKALKEWLIVAQQKESAEVTANFEWHSSFVKNTVDAQYALGLLYWQGKGVKQDYGIAEKWLQLAAHSGHSEAQLKLAYLHSSGLVGKKDYALAKTWLEKSAAQNNANAEYNLGVMYGQGLGVKADKKQAKTWLTRAKQHGDPSAGDLLAKIDTMPFAAMAEFNPIETTTAPAAKPEPVAKAKPVPAITTAEPEKALPTQTVTPPPDKTATKIPPAQTIPPLDKNTVAKTPPAQVVTPPLDKNTATKPSTGHYIVQLFSSRNKSDVEKLQAQWHDTVQPLAVAEKIKNGQQLFRLLYGEFPSESEAKQAIAKLPAELKKNSPWLFKTQADAKK